MTQDTAPPGSRLRFHGALVPLMVQALLCVDSSTAYAASNARVRGVVQENSLQRGLRGRQGTHEWMTFLIEDTSSRRVVSVEMEGALQRIIEGTVFAGSEVIAEGQWNDRNAFRAKRITDLSTGATIGYESTALRYRDGQEMMVEGDIYDLQPKQQPHAGQARRVEKWRFLLAPAASAGTTRLISVEIVKPRIRGLLRDDQPVVVTGRWTDRNVLRADRVVLTRSGEIIE